MASAVREPPCPQPLAEAVEAGLFGRCGDGTLTPSAAEVQSITREHVLQLISLRLEMDKFARAAKTGAHVRSGKIPTSRERQEANRQTAGRLRKEPQASYLGGLVAYETAFGRQAMDQLKDYIDQVVEQSRREIDREDMQLDLF